MAGPSPLLPPPLPSVLGYEPVRFVESNRKAEVVVALAFNQLAGWRVCLFDGVIEELAFGAPNARRRSPMLSGARAVLEGLFEVMAENPSLKLTVSVTSSEGDSLPQRRDHAADCASSIIDYLTDQGLDRRRLRPAAQAAPLP